MHPTKENFYIYKANINRHKGRNRQQYIIVKYFNTLLISM